MVFSQEQQVLIVEHYFATRSYAHVTDEFRLRYLDTAVPNNATITRLINNFQENGSVVDKKRAGRPAILTEAKLFDRLSAQAGISYGNAQQAMKKLHRRTYHVRCVQELKGPDKDKRLVYCTWFRSFVDDHGIAQLEAWFHLSGYVNSQNSRIWSSANPHVLHEKPLHFHKLERVYQNTVTQFIALLDIDERDCWFQHNGATYHTSNATMQFLCKFFGDSLIFARLWPPFYQIFSFGGT
ncbi:hypothetical protein PR048_029277 [Dryococelus australis]|uniref:DUF4817 domain-containing protein n=1 Tax=Dryococelus australis TaxID=614101 RepID=A0ABQ9GG29_9NEOP|nr:hypothetical protein PR048_029277 [Dryococelus australis]